MTLALDTSVLVELERKNPIVLHKLRRLSRIHKGIAVLPFISYLEFYHGLYHKNSKNREKLLKFVEEFSLLTCGKRTAEILSELQHKYERSGFTLPLADFLIAAQTIEAGCVLVTLDSDFNSFEELNKVIVEKAEGGTRTPD